MPERWWVPLAGIRPEPVKPEHLHAAVSRWFDRSDAEHDAVTKPYAISPLGQAGDATGRIGFEVSTLTPAARDRLADHGAGTEIRLGGQVGRLGRTELLAQEAWIELAEPSGERRWELGFLTPATFRRGDRSSPLPVPSSALRGLQDSWAAHSGLPPRTLTAQQSDQIWVSDLAGRSEELRISGVTLSGFVGRVTFRCPEQSLADVVDGLFRLAPYTGVGSFKAKGLGVTRLLSRPRPAARRGRAG